MSSDLDKLIEDTLNSVDGIRRAEAKPYLMTRIRARMEKGTASAWEKAGWFISRPAVAFAGLCLLILVNVIVVMNTSGSNAPETVAQSTADEYAYNTVSTIYDIENTQP